MLTLLPADERGHAHHGWLTSHHTFSFADFYDTGRMGFRALRVLNDDTVRAGQGFGTHGHRDMEILSYVLDGALEHRDSMGTGSVIRPGDVQRMSAGTGVRHSEYNASSTEDLRFLQIWIVPAMRNVTPGYAQKHFPLDERRGRLVVLASGDGRDGSIPIHQDAVVMGAFLDGDAPVTHPLAVGRGGFVHVARGEVIVNGERLRAGDALAATDVDALVLADGARAEVLVFDLA